jgi:hypothetical protein
MPTKPNACANCETLHDPGEVCPYCKLSPSVIRTLVTNWKKPEAEYTQGNRAWLPCTETFWYEMLGVLPPLYVATVWGVSEAWKDNEQGQPLYLFFRQDPYACRVATVAEIKAELSTQVAGEIKVTR